MSLDRSVTIPSDTLVRKVGGETVLLNLDNEIYYGLDDVSTDFWNAIVEAPDLATAAAQLAEVFHVDEARLTADLTSFVEDLVVNGLLEVDQPA